MAQVTDQSVNDGSGLEVLTQLNEILGALFSGNQGVAAPTVTVPGMRWADTNSGEVVTRIRNAADDDWIELATLAALTAAQVPAGSVIWYAASAAPTGYLKANGALVSRTTYADLFTAIGTTFGVGDGSTTFGLPDLRGEFIRGWDDARGIDSGRVFGSAQNATRIPNVFTDSGSVLQTAKNSPIGESDGSVGGSITRTLFGPGTDSGTITQYGTVRPRNRALLACIKF
ncbi:phage tail protein [Roseicyclus marinus]|uniref:phage tail protein n=1 Tax=Roseicyclus marinus TaxID=2161673 RepID=UPI00240F816A|nr:phage tail protein [Roseicyclus marinus]MDG3040430.1 phage tail protein [Roseicyclus marinus]